MQRNSGHRHRRAGYYAYSTPSSTVGDHHLASLAAFPKPSRNSTVEPTLSKVVPLQRRRLVGFANARTGGQVRPILAARRPEAAAR